MSHFPSARCYWVAYSGGIDSEVLLNAMAELRPRLKAEVRAVHLDHGLQTDSPAWASHCRRSCARLGVMLTVQRLELTPEPGKSLEALARDARYGALSGIIGDGDLVLTGQHRDDQAETLLLALLRGSGPKGLSAMPAVAPLGGGHLARPLLGFGRADLRAYARARRLAWIEDSSNADLVFDRNFLRRRVLPLLTERWPACSEALARSAAHCAEAQGLIDRLSKQTLGEIAGRRPGTLSISGLRGCDRALAKAALRHWVRGLGLPTPNLKHVHRILDEILAARADATPMVAWSGCEVRSFRDDLFAMAPLPPPPGQRALHWSKGPLELPQGIGRLALKHSDGRIADPTELSPSGLAVRFGVTGANCRPRPRMQRRALTKLFQEGAVPAWLRPYVPFVFTGDTLVAVGDLCTCFSTPRAEGRQFRIIWYGGVRHHPAFATSGIENRATNDRL